MEKPKGKRLFGRRRRRKEDNIKMDIKKCGVRICSEFNWIRVGKRGRLLWT
jgi:hypothetical protein